MDGERRGHRLTTRILAILAMFLAAVLLLGTILAFTHPSGGGTPAAEKSAGDSQAFYTGMGTVRARTSDGEAVVVTITFPWDSSDLAFSEELEARKTEFRAATVSLFNSLSGSDLKARGEAGLKAELLERYNDLLLLGRIELIYFKDYLVVPN